MVRCCRQDMDDATDAAIDDPEDEEEEEEEEEEALPACDEKRSVLRPMRTRTVSPGRRCRGSRI